MASVAAAIYQPDHDFSQPSCLSCPAGLFAFAAQPDHPDQALDEVPAALRPDLEAFMRDKTEYQDEAGRRILYAYDLATWAGNLLYGAGLAAPLPLATLNVAELRAATLRQAA